MLDLLRATRTDGQTRVPLREGALSLDMRLPARARYHTMHIRPSAVSSASAV
jgi:hypothetical protein